MDAVATVKRQSVCGAGGTQGVAEDDLSQEAGP